MITAAEWKLLGEELVKIAASENKTVQRWFIENMCWILNEKTNPPTKMKFTPNAMQAQFLDEMWFFNTILKARQHGFCCDPSTRVLTAELQWVEIDKIIPGMEVVATDEEFESHYVPRKMRTAIVEAKREVLEEAFELTMDDGRTLILTADHRMLKRNGTKATWTKVSRLKHGHALRFITTPWGDSSYEDGWFGGLIDGEGCIRQKDSGGSEVSISQVAGPVLDRALEYVQSRGYTHRLEWDNRKSGTSSKLGNKPVARIVINRMNELFRLSGQARPTRMLAKRWWEGKELPGKRSGIGWSLIRSIKPVGKRRMIDLQTSCKTFIAEGFVSHNSSLLAIISCVMALLNDNYRIGIIDRTDSEAQKKLQKVRFTYDNLDNMEDKRTGPLGSAIKQVIPLVAPTNAHTMTFANGSVIYAATSLRGGTLNLLWVSELGAIARDNPLKAEEIMGGSMEAIAPGNVVVIESTHEGGRFGENYRMIRLAQKSPPHPYMTNMQWKFHFFGWHDNPQYAVPLYKGQILQPTPEENEYFAKLEEEIGRKLTDEQKNWYIQKSATQRDMARQYPGTPEEALRAQTEGAIYASDIAKLRAQGRVTDLICDRCSPLFTAWDIGMNDATGIWLLQIVGPDIHALDFHCANGAHPGEHAAAVMRWERTYDQPISAHYLPHDARQNKAGTTWEILLQEAGLRGTKVVNRTPDLWAGISKLRQLLPRFRFNAKTCEKEFPMSRDKIWPSGLSALEGYRKKITADGGIETAVPVHDECESGASSLRTFAEAHALGMLVGPTIIEKTARRAGPFSQNPERALMGPSKRR